MKIEKKGYNDYKINVDFLELLDIKNFIFSRIKECETLIDFSNSEFLKNNYTDEIYRLEKLYRYISNYIDADLLT